VAKDLWSHIVVLLVAGAFMESAQFHRVPPGVRTPIAKATSAN
jgi:hypothetical protein